MIYISSVLMMVKYNRLSTQATMSKLAVFLCALIFASAANASYWSDALENIQQKVVGVIDSTINTIRDTVNAAQQKAEEVAAKLLDEAKKLTKRVQDEIKNLLDKAEEEINQLTAKAEGVDVTECTEMFSHLEFTALAVVANMSHCVTDKLETGSGYIESMIKISEDVLANLTKIREEAYHCGDNIDGIKAAAGAIVCANAAAAKATWTSAKVVPDLTVKVTKLGYLLGTLQPALAYCTTSNGIVTFYQESSNIIDNTKKCIQQKIDEVRESLPEISEESTDETFATEEVDVTEKDFPTEEVFVPEEVTEKVEEVTEKVDEVAEEATE